MRIVVVDIGGTSVKSGIIENGVLLERRETPSDALRGGEHLMQLVQGIIKSYSDFDAIGISTAGQVDSDAGIIRYANQNIPGYTGMRVRQMFQEVFGVPVSVENDVNAAAMGEAIFGAGKRAKDGNFLCLTYGTGIGGAVILDGKLFKGATYSAGEFGHIITRAGNVDRQGFYENYASTRVLLQAVQAILSEVKTGTQIFGHLAHPVVKATVDAWIDEVLYGLASIIHVFNPSLVVLGGGIMEEVYVTEALQTRIKTHIMPSFADVVLCPAQLGNDAGLWGMAHIASTAVL